MNHRCSAVRRAYGLLGGLMALGIAAAPAHSQAGIEQSRRPRVDGLVAELENDRAMVSYNVFGGISDETAERIHSGIPVTFRHKVDVIAKRGFPLMPARVLARTLIETRVEYDSLTRRYDLLRRVEHRTRQKRRTPLTEEQRLVTESAEVMRTWMTELRRIEVFDPARSLSGDRLRVRVEVSLGRRYLLLVFPATISTSAEIPLGH